MTLPILFMHNPPSTIAIIFSNRLNQCSIIHLEVNAQFSKNQGVLHNTSVDGIQKFWSKADFVHAVTFRVVYCDAVVSTGEVKGLCFWIPQFKQDKMAVGFLFPPRSSHTKVLAVVSISLQTPSCSSCYHDCCIFELDQLKEKAYKQEVSFGGVKDKWEKTLKHLPQS